MLLYPANMHFHFIHKQMIEGCGWYASQWSFANMDVILVMAYFRTGEGIQGHINAQLWAGLISFVTSMTKPVIIAGDFNISPEELMTTTMSTIMQVQVLASGQATCHSGNELDWALVSTSLIANLSIKACWEVPFKPHAQLIFNWTQDLEPVAVEQIQSTARHPSCKIRQKSGIRLNTLKCQCNGWTSQPHLRHKQLGHFVTRLNDMCCKV